MKQQDINDDSIKRIHVRGYYKVNARGKRFFVTSHYRQSIRYVCTPPNILEKNNNKNADL